MWAAMQLENNTKVCAISQCSLCVWMWAAMQLENNRTQKCVPSVNVLCVCECELQCNLRTTEHKSVCHQSMYFVCVNVSCNATWEQQNTKVCAISQCTLCVWMWAAMQLENNRTQKCVPSVNVLCACECELQCPQHAASWSASPAQGEENHGCTAAPSSILPAKHTYTNVYTAHWHRHMHACTHGHTHTHAHAHTHKCTHTQTHTHTHTHTTYTCIYVTTTYTHQAHTHVYI